MKVQPLQIGSSSTASVHVKFTLSAEVGVMGLLEGLSLLLVFVFKKCLRVWKFGTLSLFSLFYSTL